MADAESTYGTISFTDVDTIDIHTVSAQPNGANYIGTFTATLAPADDTTGGHPGTVYWTFSAPGLGARPSIAAQQSVVQTYTVTIADNHGGSTTREVAVTLTNPDHAPVFTSRAAERRACSPNLVRGAGSATWCRTAASRTRAAIWTTGRPSIPGWTGAGFLYPPQGSDGAHSGSECRRFAAFIDRRNLEPVGPDRRGRALHAELLGRGGDLDSNNSIAVNWNGQTVFARANVPPISGH